MVEMLPFGLLSAFFQEKEIRITKFDEQGTGFGFRLSTSNAAKLSLEQSPELPYQNQFRICIYDLDLGSYREILLKQVLCQKESEQTSPFYTEYWAQVEQPDFTHAIQRLLLQYSRYIHLRLEEDDSALAAQMTGYPASLDDQLDSDCQEMIQFCRKLYTLLSANPPASAELAAALERPQQYQTFLTDAPPEHVLSSCTRIYIGNEFCPLLFPEEPLLWKLLEKARRQNQKITLVFSYIRENQLSNMKELLQRLDAWCEKENLSMEAVVNDWGLAHFINTAVPHLVPCLGTLLNKRKKDPRLAFKKGNTTLFQQNNLNGDFYQKYLKQDFGISRYEWESCGQNLQLPHGKNSLHIPFYQTNTSSFCPLYAMCTHQDRGCQQEVTNCPHYCSEYAFLYPSHLHMAGRFNSLFATDTEVLEEVKTGTLYKKEIDRIVIHEF